MRNAPRAKATLATMLAGTVLAGTVLTGTALLGTGAASAAPSTNLASGPVQLGLDGPVRAYDSRTHPLFGGPISGGPFGGARIIPITNAVPPEAKGALITVTVVATRPGSTGFVAASGKTHRATSTVTWTEPGVYSNFAVVPVYFNTVISELAFDLRYEGLQPIEVVVDVQGWI